MRLLILQYPTDLFYLVNRYQENKVRSSNQFFSVEIIPDYVEFPIILLFYKF